MPSPLTDTAMPASDVEFRGAALEHLRKGRNPFASQVAAVGTAEECVLAGVPEFTANQFADLLEIVSLYRAPGGFSTRVYPMLGERGAGKTHLLYSLRDELRRRAAETGEETLLIVVERLAPGMDAIDYLVWQIANHMLAQKGDGGRMPGVIAARLTARLLAEALRQLAPHQRAELVPAKDFWSRLGLTGGSQAQDRLDRVDSVVQVCDAKHPTGDQLRDACDEAGLSPAVAAQVVGRHLDRTESKDVAGWFRRELYARLARLTLLQDRGPFEELHAGDFESAPANVKNAGNLGRRLLDTWLELLTALNLPVVVVFDQLEDYLRQANPEQEKESRQFFTDAAARFVNELRNVCMLVFAEESLWSELMNQTDPFAKQRLTQPIPLSSRPAATYLYMPNKVEPELLNQVIRNRIRFEFPNLDLTGLPPSFPFDAADLKKLRSETTIRDTLRRLATRYDQILYGPQITAGGLGTGSGSTPSPPPTAVPSVDLRKRLTDLWNEQVAAQAKEIGTEMVFSTTFIPEVQNALDGWLQCLLQSGLIGSGPWHNVRLVTDTEKQQYGYLNVIRTDGPDAPGVGVAAWLGENRGRPHDLRQRIGFFKSNPCPVRTLVMLRSDGVAALGGESKAEFDKAIRAGRDVRIHPYEPRHLHSIMAFMPWHQAAAAEVQTSKDGDPDAEKALRAVLAEISTELIGWVDEWRKPRPERDLFVTGEPASKGAKA